MHYRRIRSTADPGLPSTTICSVCRVLSTGSIDFEFLRRFFALLAEPMAQGLKVLRDRRGSIP